MEDVISDSDVLSDRFTDRAELAAVLQAALDDLNETDREILLRYYFYSETTAEIGERMAMSPERIKSRLKRGREKLKQKLGGVMP